jgi:hypothetical protein
MKHLILAVMALAMIVSQALAGDVIVHATASELVSAFKKELLQEGNYEYALVGDQTVTFVKHGCKKVGGPCYEEQITFAFSPVPDAVIGGNMLVQAAGWRKYYDDKLPEIVQIPADFVLTLMKKAMEN